MVPTIGPVHEKDTIARASAIKKIPARPPLLAFSSALFPQEEGRVISNAPRKDIANTTKSTKNAKLNQTLVDKALSAPAPKMAVTTVPKST